MINNPREPGLIERIGSVGVMGLVTLIVTGTVCGLAVYSFVEGIENEAASAYHNLLLVAAGGVLTAVGKFWGNSDNNE